MQNPSLKKSVVILNASLEDPISQSSAKTINVPKEKQIVKEREDPSSNSIVQRQSIFYRRLEQAQEFRTNRGQKVLEDERGNLDILVKATSKLS